MSLADELLKIGVQLPEQKESRGNIVPVLYQYLFDPIRPEELRAQRLKNLLAAQQQFLGKRVYRISEPLRVGTCRSITPTTVSNGFRDSTIQNSELEAYVRWDRKSASRIPLNQLMLIAA